MCIKTIIWVLLKNTEEYSENKSDVNGKQKNEYQKKQLVL